MERILLMKMDLYKEYSEDGEISVRTKLVKFYSSEEDIKFLHHVVVCWSRTTSFSTDVVSASVQT